MQHPSALALAILQSMLFSPHVSSPRAAATTAMRTCDPMQDQEACKQASAVGGRAMLCSTPHMTTKLRPGVFAFLQALSERFTMFIYTMGDASYAHNMANLLDPDRAGWFLNRIIDRGDSDWAAHQKGLSKVSAADMTAIIDDTVGALLRAIMTRTQIQHAMLLARCGGSRTTAHA